MNEVHEIPRMTLGLLVSICEPWHFVSHMIWPVDYTLIALHYLALGWD